LLKLVVFLATLILAAPALAESEDCRNARTTLEFAIIDHIDLKTKNVYVTDHWFKLDYGWKVRVLNYAENCHKIVRVRYIGNNETVAHRGWGGDTIK
jgi:hypothetical protein